MRTDCHSEGGAPGISTGAGSPAPTEESTCPCLCPSPHPSRTCPFTPLHRGRASRGRTARAGSCSVRATRAGESIPRPAHPHPARIGIARRLPRNDSFAIAATQSTKSQKRSVCTQRTPSVLREFCVEIPAPDAHGFLGMGITRSTRRKEEQRTRRTPSVLRVLSVCLRRLRVIHPDPNAHGTPRFGMMLCRSARDREPAKTSTLLHDRGGGCDAEMTRCRR